MYKIQVIAQMGDQFTGNLFMKDSLIGGLGNDRSGLYVNLRKELTTKETMLLMAYITTLNCDFGETNIHFDYIDNVE